MKYNTAVSALMILTNELDKKEHISKKDYKTLLLLLNPIAPHVTEELNEICELGDKLHICSWPIYNEEKTIDKEIEIGVQVNGKLRGSIVIENDMDSKEVESIAINNENIKKYIGNNIIKKIIVIPNRIVNILI